MYGAAMSWRRRWYAPGSGRQRRLSRAVVSVGNLRTGGTGKTPAVQFIARLLADRGERPAILTRGYARQVASDRVTVVSDGRSILATLATAGDEPLMLARALPDIPVLVGSDRYESGRQAERELGVTVHVLDDGFQHVILARDVDLLLVDEDDLNERVIPAGHLRERLASAARADALLVTAGYTAAAERIGRSLDVATTFLVTRTIRPPQMLATGESVVVPSGDPVFAVAGIARPERFFSDLTAVGWRLAGTLAFRDHHSYRQRDVARIASRAKSVRAAIVLTTDKDAVRLSACDLKELPIASVPLQTTIEPREQFADWLLERVRLCRTRHAEPETRNPVPGTRNR
jgi:tetraacyldisaccharide 4'-kinase